MLQESLGTPATPAIPGGWRQADRQPNGRRRGSAASCSTTSRRPIIEQLQQDGRRSYATIAKAVGLSEAAVRQRVQRLLEPGVMQIVAVTDPLQLGFPRRP